MNEGLKRTGTHAAIPDNARGSTRRTGANLTAVVDKKLKKTGTHAAMTDIADLLDGGTILAVDDEGYILTVYERMLRQMSPKSRIISASSVAEAQRSISRARPDLIISDIMMPEETGDVLYDWVMENRQELSGRMLFVSGGAGSETTKAGRFYAAMKSEERLLDKPFAVEQLRAAIFKILSSAQPLSKTSRIEAIQKSKRDEAIGKIRHDANGALGVMQMSADVLGLNVALQESQRLLIAEIMSAAEDLKNLIAKNINSENIPENGSKGIRETLAGGLWELFKRPLGKAMINAEALRFEQLPNEDMEMVQGILSGASRLRDIVLLLLSKIREGKEVISVNEE